VAWSPRGRVGQPDAHRLLRQTLSAFRSVKVIAEAAAALPLVLRMQSNGSRTHPLGAGGRQTEAGAGELLEALYAQLLLTGNGYFEAGLGLARSIGSACFCGSDRMSVCQGRMAEPVALNARWRAQPGLTFGDTARSDHIKNFHRRTFIMALADAAAAMALDGARGGVALEQGRVGKRSAALSGGVVLRGAKAGQVSTPVRPFGERVGEPPQGARNAGRPDFCWKRA